jgi:hypothetical protein
VHAAVMVQRTIAAARARPVKSTPRRGKITTSGPRGYLSTFATLNGAQAASTFAETRSGAITPGITRRAAPSRDLTNVVSAVGCMPLLCGGLAASPLFILTLHEPTGTRAEQ